MIESMWVVSWFLCGFVCGRLVGAAADRPPHSPGPGAVKPEPPPPPPPRRVPTVRMVVTRDQWMTVADELIKPSKL